jgi:hypothetical protein
LADLNRRVNLILFQNPLKLLNNWAIPAALDQQ